MAVNVPVCAAVQLPLAPQQETAPLLLATAQICVALAPLPSAVNVPVGISRTCPLRLSPQQTIVPLLRSAEQARQVVRATRYPPAGNRGFGPLRASQYTLDYPDYLARANRNILVAFLLETREAMESLEEITAVPGVDALYLGLWDLYLDYGVSPFEMPHPAMDRLIDRAIEVCAANGVALGTGSATPEDLVRWRDRGLTFLGYGPDFVLLANAARAGVEAFRAERE